MSTLNTQPTEPISESAKPHFLSINIYGRGDATLGDGPSHMALAIYEHDSETCEVHHIRNPDDQTFIYNPRAQPLNDPVLRGRCEIPSFTTEQRKLITQCLSAFGLDETNIPEMGTGNCQDWVAGAMASLEKQGLVQTGEGEFWKGMINLSANEMQERDIRTGRKWIDGPDRTFEGVPDARFSDGRDPLAPGAGVGKLAQNPAFRERMQTLMGTKAGGGDGQEVKVDSGSGEKERPFYISSPFFSRGHGS